MSKLQIRTITIATILLFVGLLLPKPAQAAIRADAPAITIQPSKYDPSNPITRSYFVLNMQPATILPEAVSLVNKGNAQGVVTLSPVDASTGDTSGTVYRSQSDPRTDVGSWIHLQQTRLTLAPGESVTVPFTVTIPKNPRPGQHVGGIVADVQTVPSAQPTAKAQTNKSTIQIHVKNLTIVAVQVTIPGEQVQALQATSVKAGGQQGYQNVQIALHNTGTMMLKPYGTFDVEDSTKTPVLKKALSLDTILPQVMINYPVYVSHVLTPGTYTANLLLHYGDNKTLTYSTSFTVTAQQVSQAQSTGQTTFTTSQDNTLYWLIGGIAAFILGISGLIFMLVRRTRLNQDRPRF